MFLLPINVIPKTQGHWHVPFNASKTKDEDFHVDKKTTVKKPTMHLEQSLFYTESEGLDAKVCIIRILYS